MINDQTIANFCSDTSREIDNLTEELRFYNVCSQTHSIDKRTSNSEQSDRDSDVVDSSPFYTHINHRLANSGSDLNAKPDPRDRSLSNLDAFIDSIDGAADPGDDFPSVACMLQSVDLRGEPFESAKKWRPTEPGVPADTYSPSSPPSTWDGNIETSTDTLVPVIENAQANDDFDLERLCSTALQLTNAMNSDALSDTSTQSSHKSGEGRPRTFSEALKRNEPSSADESNLSELLRADTCNGRSDSSASNSSVNAPLPALHRLRRNSSTSRKPTVDMFSPNGHVPGRLFAESFSPGATNFSARLPTPTNPMQALDTFSTNSPALTAALNVSCPDGLAHALSEQNLRLQLLVQEHKVQGVNAERPTFISFVFV